MSLRPRPPAAPLVVSPLSHPAALAHESPGRLRGPAYQRLGRGIHWCAEGELDHGVLIVAFRQLLGPDAVLAGISAAWALGVRLAGPQDPVEVVMPHGRRARARAFLRVRGDDLRPDEVCWVRSGALTGPARTALDLARRHPADRALAWVDAVMRQTGLDSGELLAAADAHPGARGIRQARAVLAIADARAESPRESMLRWLLLASGLPAPVPQHVLVDGSGAFVARLDLAWPQWRLAVEYDGDHHRERDQHSADLLRHNRLRALGWTVIQVDARQLRAPDALLAMLRRLLTDERHRR